MTTARRRRAAGRRTPPAAWCAAVVALTGACADAGGAHARPADGPLSLVAGSVTSLAVPLGEPMFFALSGCLTRAEAGTVQVVSLTPTEVRGARREDVRFLVAWPAPHQRQPYGAAGVSVMPPMFRPYAGTSGAVAPCTDGAGVTGLEVAVIVPEPADTAVVVEGYRISYALDGEQHVQDVDATFGICSARPADVAAEPRDCRGTG